MIQLISCLGLISAIGLAATYVYKRYSAAVQVAADSALRAERLKVIDQQQQVANGAVEKDETEIEKYNREYGVSLKLPTDDGESH